MVTYIAIVIVTINLIVAVTIVLLYQFIVTNISHQIPPSVLSMHFPNVTVSICVKVDLFLQAPRK